MCIGQEASQDQAAWPAEMPDSVAETVGRPVDELLAEIDRERGQMQAELCDVNFFRNFMLGGN